ncbi:NAD(P)-dependent oxidoreductase [Paenibacillus rhizovicinus]|uniref:NAD(P)-dependent oxidoreductase n=1 Tax=Paenibacillus rhizovicinus TaxID=2704463 RepID=A0A6C0P7G6_9BACL|nr:NAD(P)-dependent oxidoreductase [Paenibacillus rhizovicinus]QHW34336.1 NAD(P)-dependent oxidoreductase [Paenibacillus rhizovicinus]
MNILVTGGMGFLGSNLVPMLREQGYRVVSYDRRIGSNGGDAALGYVQGDLLDLPLLLETIRKYAIDRIIHTAAISHPVTAIDIPYQTVLTNALGTTNVFEAARLSGIKRVVNLSSEYAYGNNAQLGTVTEDVPLHPSGVYGATKVFTEKLAYGYRNLYGLEIPSLRPGWLYGPGQFMQCYMKDLIVNAIRREPTVLKEGRDYGFQYVHVKDVAQACIRAMEATEMKSFVYSITAGYKTTFGELIALVEELYPDAVIDVGEGRFQELDHYGTFDISKAREEIGYEPAMAFEESVRAYAAWLEQHPY